MKIQIAMKFVRITEYQNKKWKEISTNDENKF